MLVITQGYGSPRVATQGYGLATAPVSQVEPVDVWGLVDPTINFDGDSDATAQLRGINPVDKNLAGY